MSDVLTDLAAAVKRLGDEKDELLDACTDPQALDMAELLLVLQEQHKALGAITRDVEVACAKAMPGDDVRVPGLLVERSRGTERKAWRHDDWQADVRRQVLRQHGLAGARGVLTADGEVLDAGVLHEVLRAVEAAHAAAAPKVTVLRGLGLDSRDYCESSPGAWRVKVTRLADESASKDEEAA